MFDYYDEWELGSLMFPPIPKPNLITGEGHGHCRASDREKPKKNHKQLKRNKRKQAKKSKQRNRK